MQIAATELNKNLSSLLHKRASVEKSLAYGQVLFWRLVGAGLMALGLGLFVGIGCYGYSFVMRNSVNLSALATIFSRALSEATLHAVAEGAVDLGSNEITLAKGETIVLDQNSRISLEAGAKVQAEGDIRIQNVPTISAPITMQRPAIPTVTNFTVFKRVLHDRGAVMTGWVFLTSAQKSPTSEYCYYTESADTPGVNVRLNLGSDQKPDFPKSPPRNFDIHAAFEKCVWFRSES